MPLQYAHASTCRAAPAGQRQHQLGRRRCALTISLLRWRPSPVALNPACPPLSPSYHSAPAPAPPAGSPCPCSAETQLKQRDAAELVAGKKPAYLSLQAGQEGAHFMLIEMKEQK